MIQRIQSVYLILIFVFCLLGIFLSIGTIQLYDLVQPAGTDTGPVVIKLTGTTFPEGLTEIPEKSVLGIVALAISFIAMGVSAFTILQFKKRAFQIQLTKLLVLLLVGKVVAIFYYAGHYKDFFAGAEFAYQIGVFFPLVSMMLGLLAIKSIRKDDLLVKSADRIR